MSSDRPLFSEDFEGFPIGTFPHDYSPLGEYHCVEPEGYRGGWTELTVHHSWRNSPGWLVGEEDGNKFMEHAAVRDKIPSILAAGDPFWEDYRVQVRVRLLSDKGYAGVAARMEHSRSYYLLCIEGTVRLRLKLINFEERTDLAEYDLSEGFDPERWHLIALEVKEEKAAGYLDGVKLFEVEHPLERPHRGQIGLVATCPARFDDISVLPLHGESERLSTTHLKAKRELEEIREKLPKPVLWRRIKLGDFGAGKSVRFGDLDGDGQIEILMAQNIKRLDGGNFGMISCLTAFNLQGEVLWQIGEPNPKHALLTADLPMQIHDFDGDGRAEVIICKDFRIQVLDGMSGKLKMEAPTPRSLPSHQWLKEDIFFRITGDSICFADLSGRGHRGELLVKDRYNHIWAYDYKLEPLWNHACSTGHYPFPYDVDGDGRDEVFVGSTLLDEDGRVIWSLEMEDHVDTIAVVDLKGGGNPIVLFASGDAGLYAVDLEGKVIFHEKLGHMQELCIARFRDDVEGLQFFTKTFWGYPGIIFLYDADLRRRLSMQGYPLGFSTFPVNWSGEGMELIFASPHPAFGGLYDGWGRKVVRMPEDDHPNLCYHPLNVTGDARDELLCWDEREMWIYTQSEPFRGEKIYSPKRMPLCNFSNYRSEISLPSWSDL
ncbi:TPA: hypothetical protein EYP37_08220 [Candidatus Poribacteria bacterium]|nr:hypothetical protein [Candidatus Poribacteria bacterium]